MNKKEIENRIIFGDCMDILPKIDSGIIDMIFADLPYGTTRNKWDSVLPLDKLWEQYWRILKPNGAVVLTAAQPFTSSLIMSNLKTFKVEWIWEKTISSGQLNISHQPLRNHEQILVFYKLKPVYNAQMTKGDPYTINRKVTFEGPSYNGQKDSSCVNVGERYPKTVLRIANPRIKAGHPTQKPVELVEYFINTYSNPGDLVLDNCIGSGTTAIAAINTSRLYVGIENNKEYYEMTINRIKEVK